MRLLDLVVLIKGIFKKERFLDLEILKKQLNDEIRAGNTNRSGAGRANL